MQTEILNVTPQLAATWLKLNTNNRPVSRRNLQSLTHAMKSSEWKLNGESIKLNDDVLIDGQHRLMACVNAGVPFKSLVIKGMDRDVFDTIDTGSKRDAADIFAINGEKNVCLLASSIRTLAYYLDPARINGVNRTLSNQEYERLLDEHPAIRDHATWYMSNRVKFVPGSIACPGRYICSLIDEDMSNDFYSKLLTGEGLTKGSPVMALRNKLIDNLASVEKIPPKVKFNFVVKAWNLYRDNRSITSLRSPGTDQIKFK